MRLINADKIHPDVRTQHGALAISQGQLAYAETINAIPIPEDATNGDVLKKMFPTAKFYCAERLQTAGMPRRNADFDVDWWNAPYRESEG